MNKRILITGDVIVDHHIYEGERYIASATDQRGVKAKRQHGGAKGLTDLIDAMLHRAIAVGNEAQQKRVKEQEQARQELKKAEVQHGEEKKVKELQHRIKEAENDLQRLRSADLTGWSAQFGLTLPPLDAIPSNHHAFAVWKPFPKSDEPGEKACVWRANLLMGYGHDTIVDDSGEPNPDSIPPTDLFQPQILPDLAEPDILVLDDAGCMFRTLQQRPCWHLPPVQGQQTPWIVLKMSSPVCRGDLWNDLASSYSDRLILVVSAKELREEMVHISRGLSWELTTETLRDALLNDPILSRLARYCRHLIVVLSGDGALWLDCRDLQKPQASLIYDPGNIEGAWADRFKGSTIGHMSCMVAAVTHALVKNIQRPEAETSSSEPDLSEAIAAGLAAMRNLQELGHGVLDEKGSAAGYPAKRLAQILIDKSRIFQKVAVPWPPDSIGTPGTWSILEQAQRPFNSDINPSLLGLARLTVLKGNVVLKKYPYLQLGGLFTADRVEIECLRAMHDLMLNYDRSEAVKPLSIGVFGPPGAGKSFGVRTIAESIFSKKSWREFNLSQFDDIHDLIGAFHQVRDIVLGGITPVIFWDEFDSQEYKWLQYLLAPMQDGKFQEGQITHAMGKCVFIFAGATSYTYSEFGPPRSDQEAWRRFRLLKGPDFHSRLDTYYNVLGPNPRLIQANHGASSGPASIDPDDRCYPLRRAILLRHFLAPKSKDVLDLDSGLLTALLEAPLYRHGARSMEKIADSLRPSQHGRAIRRSALPAPTVLAMHLSFAPGASLSDEPGKQIVAQFQALAERELAFKEAAIIAKLAPAIHAVYSEGLDQQDRVEFNQLSEFLRKSNHAAAERMSEILSLVGLRLEAGSADLKEHARIRGYLAHHLDLLAEAEHNGWMKWHFEQGWRFAEVRDNSKQLHNCLQPFEKLAETDKEKDRSQILHYPDFAEKADLRIVFSTTGIAS